LTDDCDNVIVHSDIVNDTPMKQPPALGLLQQLTMLAVARLGDDAFGASIRQELEEVTGRSVSISTVYVTLIRLEDQKLVRSRQAKPELGRGGPGKRFFAVTAKGWVALEAARNAVAAMWKGVKPILDR
jgi:PadR family transcriptional regulator PadR